MPLPTCISSLCKFCSCFLVGSNERATASRRSSSCCIRVGSPAVDHLGQTIWSSRSCRTRRRLSQTDHPVFASYRSQCICSNGFARARARRCTREGVATLLTADQSLHDTGLDGAPTRSNFVFLEQFLARTKLSSLTRAGTGISIHSSRGVRGLLSWWARSHPPTLWAHYACRAEARVLPKQATPR